MHISIRVDDDLADHIERTVEEDPHFDTISEYVRYTIRKDREDREWNDA